ncbi:MAG: hypothetical protein ABSH36_09570 [Solirubrobacteraceae bacterium]
MGFAPQGGSAGRRSPGESAEAYKLARVVFAALVVACFVAFVLTQRLKHTPTPVQEFKMDTSFTPTRVPAAGCRGRVPPRLVNSSEWVEYLAFKIAQADEVTVEIVDSANHSVATIVRDLPVEKYKPLSLCWNGQLGPTQSGGLAPPGEYRLRVSLRNQDLSRYSTTSFKLEPHP